MRYKTLLFFLLLSFGVSTAQIDGSLLVGLTTATSLEITAITNPVEGSLVYNSDESEVYVYRNSEWKTISKSNVYLGVLIISSTGDLTISGLPFRPTKISFNAHANIESLNINSDNGVGNNNNSIPNNFGSMSGFARNDDSAITQQVIYAGGSGASINDISRYASSNQCIGIRYANNNGDNIGITSAILTDFNTDGFTLNVDNHSDDLVVLYHAYQ